MRARRRGRGEVHFLPGCIASVVLFCRVALLASAMCFLLGVRGDRCGHSARPFAVTWPFGHSSHARSVSGD